MKPHGDLRDGGGEGPATIKNSRGSVGSADQTLAKRREILGDELQADHIGQRSQPNAKRKHGLRTHGIQVRIVEGSVNLAAACIDDRRAHQRITYSGKGLQIRNSNSAGAGASFRETLESRETNPDTGERAGASRGSETVNLPKRP
jgi:hypothetical protein